MAILPIVLFPDRRLRLPALPVPQVTQGLHDLAADMLDTMYAAPGRGLAGPQVGVLLRIFVMDVTWRDGTPSPCVCLNPEIIDASDDLATGQEGCLSIPGVGAVVTRPAEITLRWTDLSGQQMQERLTGFAAICAQHELDHLNGRLCIDLMDEASRMADSPALSAMGAA
ncbi:MAG: peptide deformylase [Gemmobacter sp.]|nr:peptide deformylase [Gemmobacter sp.]